MISVSNLAVLVDKLSSLPAEKRERIAGYISDHFEELEEEARWEESYVKTASGQTRFANEIRQQISQGLAEDMDLEKL